MVPRRADQLTQLSRSCMKTALIGFFFLGAITLCLRTVHINTWALPTYLSYPRRPGCKTKSEDGRFRQGLLVGDLGLAGTVRRTFFLGGETRPWSTGDGIGRYPSKVGYWSTFRVGGGPEGPFASHIFP